MLADVKKEKRRKTQKNAEKKNPKPPEIVLCDERENSKVKKALPPGNSSKRDFNREVQAVWSLSIAFEKVRVSCFVFRVSCFVFRVSCFVFE